MILQVFAVRDLATEMFGNPMFLVSRGQAVRGFSDEVNRDDKENQLYRHPQDFALYSLGEFDTSSGRFVTPADPVVVVRAVDVRVRADPVG